MKFGIIINSTFIGKNKHFLSEIEPHISPLALAPGLLKIILVFTKVVCSIRCQGRFLNVALHVV